MAKNPIKPVLIDTYADPGLQYLNQKPEYFNVPSANVKTSNATPVYDQVTQVITNVINVSLPAGTNNEVQFNTNGTMSGDNEFKYDPNTDTLTVTNIKANTVSLGDVTSSKMQGGSNGDVLKTDGHGNLHFDAIFPSVSGQSGKVLKTDGITQVWGNVSYNDLTNTPSFATQSYVNNAIGDLINGAPSALNTLNELANALGNNASFASTITNALANKAEASALSNVAFTGSYNSLTNTPTIPSLTGLATETFVTSRGYINSSALSTTLTNYATTSYVGSQGFITSGTLTGYGYVTSDALSGYALTTDIPTDINQLNDADGLLAPSNPFDQDLNTTDEVQFYLANVGALNTTGLITVPSTGSASGIQTVNGLNHIYFETDNSLQIIVNDIYEHVFNADGSVVFGGGYVFPNVTGSTGQVLVAGDNPLYLEWQNQSSGGQTFDQDLNSTNTPTFAGMSLSSDLVGTSGDFQIITPTESGGNIDLYTDWSGHGVEVWLQHNDRVSIKTENGAYAWDFDNTGNLVLPQADMYASPAPVLSGIVFSDGTFQNTAATTSSGLGNLSINGNEITSSENYISLKTGDNSSYYAYHDQAANYAEIYTENDSEGANPAWAWINTSLQNGHQNPEALIEVQDSDSGVTKRWTFDKDGFKHPNDVLQRSGEYVNCDANMDTVIYTSANEFNQTLKLLINIEGVEDGQSQTDTQSCEMMVAKTFRNNSVAGSAYGLVYTSNSPLAVLTARWNSTISRIEIVCRPTSTMNGVSVHATATELLSSTY